jgi:hypothetical protein
VRGGGVAKPGEEGKIGEECRGGGVGVRGRFKSSLYSFIFCRTLSGLRGINPVFLKEEIAMRRLLKTLLELPLKCTARLNARLTRKLKYLIIK